MQSQKWQNDLCSFLRQTIQYHSNPKCWRSWSWTVPQKPTRPSRSNTQKRCPFHYRGPECKSRKSGDTWSKGKFGLGIQNEAVQRLTEFCQENALVIADTLFQQHKRRLCTWTSPHAQHRNQTDYILCCQIWRSSTQAVKIRPGADCGSDQQLLIGKFRLKLKKVGKTIRPFRCYLNQIPYNYTVEVTIRFKGLDLIRESAWRTMDGGSWHCTGGSDQDHP